MKRSLKQAEQEWRRVCGWVLGCYTAAASVLCFNETNRANGHPNSASKGSPVIWFNYVQRSNKNKGFHTLSHIDHACDILAKKGKSHSLLLEMILTEK